MKRLLCVAAAVLLLATGCGNSDEHEDKRGRDDAPVAGRKGEDSPAFCTNMPDKFGNLCGKCVYHFKPWAVVVTTSTAYAPSNMMAFQAPEQCGGKAVPGVAPVMQGGPVAVPPDDEN